MKFKWFEERSSKPSNFSKSHLILFLTSEKYTVHVQPVFEEEEAIWKSLTSLPISSLWWVLWAEFALETFSWGRKAPPSWKVALGYCLCTDMGCKTRELDHQHQEKNILETRFSLSVEIFQMLLLVFLPQLVQTTLVQRAGWMNPPSVMVTVAFH